MEMIETCCHDCHVPVRDVTGEGVSARRIFGAPHDFQCGLCLEPLPDELQGVLRVMSILDAEGCA